MTDQQNPDRPQTLLEAAKVAMDAYENVPSYDAWRTARNHLRAAIAREEAKPSGYSNWEMLRLYLDGTYRPDPSMPDDPTFDAAVRLFDRAQQAESTAAWHKAESERLSQALAEAKKSVAYLANRACDTIPVDTSGHWQQRAEDAEAKVRNLQRQNRDAVDERDRLRFHTETIDNLRQRAEKAEAELADQIVRAARWHDRAVRAERALLRAGWTDCGGEEWKPPLGPSHPMDGGDITVMLNRAGVASAAGWSLTQRIEWLVGEWKAERALKESFRRDSQGVRTDMRAWNHRLGEVVPVADNPIDTVRAVIAEVHDLRCKVALAKEALGVKS